MTQPPSGQPQPMPRRPLPNDYAQIEGQPQQEAAPTNSMGLKPGWLKEQLERSSWEVKEREAFEKDLRRRWRERQAGAHVHERDGHVIQGDTWADDAELCKVCRFAEAHHPSWWDGYETGVADAAAKKRL